jgi:hypothetical protein
MPTPLFFDSVLSFNGCHGRGKSIALAQQALPGKQIRLSRSGQLVR